MVSRSLFCTEILHSVVQHIDRPLPGINLSVPFWASTSYKLEVKEDLDTEKKIEKSRYLKNTSRYRLKLGVRKLTGSGLNGVSERDF